MTLGQIIKRFLDEHEMSMRSFSQKAGLSTAYISMLINGRANGSIPVPTLETYEAVSKAMGLSLDELLRSVNDNISLVSTSYTEKAPLDEREMLIQKLADKLSHMSPEQIQELLRYAQYIQSRQEEP